MEFTQEMFEPALGIKEPFYIKEFKVDNENLKIDIYIDFRKKYRFKVPSDKRYKRVAYDTIQKTWKHLFLWQYETYIHARLPRIKLKKNIRIIDVPWAKKGSGLSISLEKQLIDFSMHMPVSQVANKFKIKDTMIWRRLEKYTKQELKNKNFENVVKIGVDETSRKRGHNYITTFLDLDSKKIIFITKGKDSSTFKEFKTFFEKHKGKCKNIKEVSIDMSGAFIKGVNDVLPNARITFDKFHIIQKINIGVDNVRREEAKTNMELKYSRYYWLKNPNKLNKKGKKFFNKIEGKKWDTIKAYEYKLEFNNIFNLKSDKAIIAFQEWIDRVEKGYLEPMKKAARTIKEYLDGIMSWFYTGINNGILECKNSMIQMIKSRARGFKNTKYFKEIIYLNFG